MAVVSKSIIPPIEGYVTLQGGADTIRINKIEAPTWIHEGFKLLVEFDQSNIGAGVWIENFVSTDVAGQNIRMIPFGFKTANVNLDSGMTSGKDSIGWLIDAVNEIITSGGAAAAKLANAVSANNLAVKSRASWTNPLGQKTIHGIKGTGAVPSGAFDFTNMFPVYTFVWDGTIWKQTAFAFNNYS